MASCFSPDRCPRQASPERFWDLPYPAKKVRGRTKASKDDQTTFFLSMNVCAAQPLVLRAWTGRRGCFAIRPMDSSSLSTTFKRADKNTFERHGRCCREAPRDGEQRARQAVPSFSLPLPPVPCLHHVERVEACREGHPVVVQHALHPSIPALEVDRLAATPSPLLRGNGVQVRYAAHDHGTYTVLHATAVARG